MPGITTKEIERIAEAVTRNLRSDTDQLMNVQQAAAYLGCSASALRKRCSCTSIPRHKRDGILYFSKIELNNYYLNRDK